MHKKKQKTTQEIFEGQLENIEFILNTLQEEFNEFRIAKKPSVENIIKARETLKGLRAAERFLND